MYSKHRLEMLSDAVFAIAMTLLILDLKVPADVAPGHLVAALMQEKGTWLSVILTFLLSASMWTLQHRVFDITEKIDKFSLALTFCFLGGVSILPFSTSLLGVYYATDRSASVFYVCVLFMIFLSLTVQFEWSRWKMFLHSTRSFLTLRLELFAGTIFMGCAGLIIRFAHSERSKVYLLIAAILLSTLIRRIGMLKFWSASRTSVAK